MTEAQMDKILTDMIFRGSKQTAKRSKADRPTIQFSRSRGQTKETAGINIVKQQTNNFHGIHIDTPEKDVAIKDIHAMISAFREK